MRGLLRIATTLRVPRMVLAGDEKQLGAVEAGKPFEQLRRARMQTAVMDEILRQRDMELREAVRAGLAGEVRTPAVELVVLQAVEITGLCLDRHTPDTRRYSKS